MAGCFDNPRLSQEAVSNCMQRCEMPLKQVNAVVKQEINGFQQDRMQRCAMGCQDEAKDLAPSDAKEGDRRLDKVIKQVLSCWWGGGHRRNRVRCGEWNRFLPVVSFFSVVVRGSNCSVWKISMDGKARSDDKDLSGSQ
ncbi:unnamed protein product [Discosporangium mesarthrocarpum]